MKNSGHGANSRDASERWAREGAGATKLHGDMSVRVGPQSGFVAHLAGARQLAADWRNSAQQWPPRCIWRLNKYRYLINNILVFRKSRVTPCVSCIFLMLTYCLNCCALEIVFFFKLSKWRILFHVSFVWFGSSCDSTNGNRTNGNGSALLQLRNLRPPTRNFSSCLLYNFSRAKYVLFSMNGNIF